MFIAVLASAVAALLGFFGFVATRPDEFRVERRGHINAPPERVYSKIVDFKRWPEWSPWEALDTNMRRTLSGAPSGPGAIYEWEGNKKVGKGRMEITGIEPSKRVAVKLDFIKPFEAHNVTEFLLDPHDGGTNVTWVMTGQNAFMSKLFGVFMNIDQLVGKDFEKGLANLRRESEK